MKSRNIVAAIALVFVASTAVVQAAGIDARQAHQESRIAHGVADGQLTRCEAARLEHRETRIERTEARYRNSGGLQPWERRNLNQRLNSSSRDIHEQRHDGAGCW